MLPRAVPSKSNHLVILVQSTKVACLNQAADFIIAETYPVIEITEPNDGIMIIDGSVPLEPKTVADGMVVNVPLLIVRKASSQMSCHQALTDEC